MPDLRSSCGLLLALSLLAACSPTPESVSQNHGSTPLTADEDRPSLLLITLDTTRADHLGFTSDDIETPHLEALAARGSWFSQAYSTVPTTLPAHTSMMTGLYPAEHGIHENARYVDHDRELLGDRLRRSGYLTAAFVSGFPLASQFGLARSFDHYDDAFVPERSERPAGETTDRALAYLDERGDEALFLWVHYFDPHEPYAPPEPFRSTYAEDLYLGEIAYMDHELGRLIEAFDSKYRQRGGNILVVGDHGEGRGDHGEELHGNLLYQGVMRVPLLMAGTDIASGHENKNPVSIRRVFDTLLDWAGADSPHSLMRPSSETVMAEAMKPHLQYGWQPQVMAVRGPLKVIRSGDLEIYDVSNDPEETTNLAGQVELSSDHREALQAYPFQPSPTALGNSDRLSQNEREQLASLGYVGWDGRSALRDDAPDPKDMTHLFADLDRGSSLFVRQRYDEAITVFEQVLELDPYNLMVAVRLAVAHSVNGRDEEALTYFARAREIAPESADVRHYQGLHHLRRQEWQRAATLLESVLAQNPDRLPTIEGLAQIRQQQGQVDHAIELLERVTAARPTTANLARLGELYMAKGETTAATIAFERSWASADGDFAHFLELGVLYLASRRFPDARDSLDRVSSSHPSYPMALFKRAQVSVLLNEADSAERIRRAREHADDITRRLIEQEALFRGQALPNSH